MLKIMDNLFDKINSKYNIKLAVYMCAAILMTLKRHHSEKLILFFLLKTKMVGTQLEGRTNNLQVLTILV